MPRIVLVTGGAGFIGSHVVEALLSRGDQVVVFDDFDDFYDPAVKRDNIAVAADHPNCKVVEGDLRVAEDLERVFADAPFDAVIHLAARAGVRPSIHDPELYDSVNVAGTTRLLQQIRQRHVPYLVFGSSSSVYGSNAPVPFSEDQPADRPSSPYAATKRAGELACHVFHELFGVDVTCLRFFTVYGPRQRPEMAIHRFTRLIASGRPVPVFGDGTARRDFTYVDDIVSGVVAALDRPGGYNIYNLGTTAVTTIADLVKMIGAALGVEAQIRFEPAQPGDVPITYADISKAQRALEYQPMTQLAAGLALFVSWFRARAAG